MWSARPPWRIGHESRATRRPETSTLKSARRTTLSHCHRRVHTGADKTLEVVLAHRLPFVRCGRDAAKRRADAASRNTPAMRRLRTSPACQQIAIVPITSRNATTELATDVGLMVQRPS